MSRGDWRKTRSRTHRFGAIIPADSGGTGNSTTNRWYKTANAAAGARRRAWAVHHGRQAKRNTVRSLKMPANSRLPQCNKRENKFAKWAERQPMVLHRGGWPDFLCIMPDGQIVGIEVKSDLDTLSADQLRCHTLLQEAGLTTFVWTEGEGLEPWSEYAEKRLATDAGAKAAGQSHTRRDRGPTPRHENPASGVRIPETIEPSDQTLHQRAV